MLEKELNKIEIDGKEYKLKCTIASLEKMQDKYKSYIEFEKKFRNVVEANGKEMIEPNIEATLWGLREFMQAAGEEVPANLDELAWNKGIYVVANIVLKTFLDCFNIKETKNTKATQGKK